MVLHTNLSSVQTSNEKLRELKIYYCKKANRASK